MVHLGKIGDKFDEDVSRMACGLVEAALTSVGVSPEISKLVGERACKGPMKSAVRTGRKESVKKAKKTAKDIKKSKAMKQAQAKARKANGKFKKGWDKSRLMKEYHRIYKRLKS